MNRQKDGQTELANFNIDSPYIMISAQEINPKESQDSSFSFYRILGLGKMTKINHLFLGQGSVLETLLDF